MLMRQTDYARHRGVSPQYINKLIRLERIPVTMDNGIKLIDQEQADAILDQTADPAKSAGGQHRNYDRAGKPDQTVVQQKLDIADEDDGKLTFAAVKARKEYWAAQSAELKARKEAGELVDKVAISRVLRDIEDRKWSDIEDLPHRLAQRLAAETEPREIIALLQDEIRKVRLGEVDRLIQAKHEGREGGGHDEGAD